VVARAQLLALGLDADAIAYRRKVGRLHPLYRGVYAVGHRAPSPLAAAMAAVLACGPQATLSHRSAAALWRIVPRWHLPVDVSAPRRRRHPGIRVRHSRQAETTTHHGIPATTPAQTLLDLADVLDDRALARAVNEAYVQRLTTPQDLAALLTRSPGRRTTRLTLHTTAATPTRSHLEDDFLRFVKRHRLPVPETNQRIAGHEVDFVWRTHHLVAELDGYAFHTTKSAFERDRERDADLLNAGFRTLRITHRRLKQQAKQEAKRLRSLLRPDP
jgi:very-short-patch-repair endonuclease